MIINDYSNMPSFPCGIASYADVLRGASRVSLKKIPFPLFANTSWSSCADYGRTNQCC